MLKRLMNAVPPEYYILSGLISTVTNYYLTTWAVRLYLDVAQWMQT